MGRESKMEELVGRDKDSEITYQLPSQAKQARPGENEITDS